MNGISKFIGSSVCAVAFLFAVGEVSAANLIANPGFETGTTASWLTLGTGVGATITVQTPDNGPSAAGSFNAYMTNSIAANNLALQQSTPNGSAVPGLVNYSFDLKFGSSLNGGVFFVHIWDVNSVGGVIDQGPGLLQPNVANDGNWHTFAGSFTAPATVNHLEIEFDCTTGAAAGSAESMHVDNVSLTQAVPEPTTVTLVGLGLFGAVAFGRKRKS
ncbi:MAG TPA: PEP-CTERM sorting domain-containing protein [Verrucomicrobiae bacterium]|nr:PEP-CTERM sorting domain-containing protein [Verrucomicrobiae bacterium]